MRSLSLPSLAQRRRRRDCGAHAFSAKDARTFHAGTEISQTSPLGCQSNRTVPLSCSIIRTMTRLPKPLRVGGSTGGPPVSVHRRTSPRSALLTHRREQLAAQPAGTDHLGRRRLSPRCAGALCGRCERAPARCDVVDQQRAGLNEHSLDRRPISRVHNFVNVSIWLSGCEFGDAIEVTLRLADLAKVLIILDRTHLHIVHDAGPIENSCAM